MPHEPEHGPFPTASNRERAYKFVDEAGNLLWAVETEPTITLVADMQVDHGGTLYKVEKTVVTMEIDAQYLTVYLSVVA